MSDVRIASVESPFDTQEIARLAQRLISTAEAMGLLRGLEIRRLDKETFQRFVERLGTVGIGLEAQAALSVEGRAETPREFGELLRRLTVAIEESPVPTSEWQALGKLFGLQTLAGLLGTSLASARRYQAADRRTPDLLAGRLHFLATLVGDLAGAYNEYGIRRWFDRPRTLLDGRSPRQLLGKDWDPESPPAHRIRKLARSLGASAAT